MGVPIVVVGNKHICPMSDGTKPHVGGTVTQGIDGVLIDGIPVAVKGSKCICTGGSSPDEIVQGCSGVLIDGQPVAILGSMTQHGGVIIEGVPGVTISGPLVPLSGDPAKMEPKIFNLQWKKENRITQYGNYNEFVTLSADSVGYEDGEKVTIKIYAEGSDEVIEEVEGTVQNGRVEVEWELDKDKINGDGEDGSE